MSRYRLFDLRSGAMLFESSDRDDAFAAAKRSNAEGHVWDDLDLIDVESGHLLMHSHESAVRSFIAESEGAVYRSFRTLAEAQAAPVAAVIVEGDYGGQIFVTCPARLVRCTEERLRRLADELETTTWTWQTSYTGGAQVLFEPLPVGVGVWGGMGGGIVVDGVWVHEEIRQLGWAAQVEAVLRGSLAELGQPHPVVPPEVRAGVLRAYADRVDVFCHVFGFPVPDHIWKMHRDEWIRREDEVIPPPASDKRWRPSTLRAVLAEELGAGGS